MPRTEPVKAVRGVRDLLPRELAYWRVAQAAAVEVARGFGYEEIVTPVVEHAELIERAGDDSDAFVKELYRFEDRGGRRLALRPEATAGIVRAYFERGLNQGVQPARLYLVGPMFRYDRPQKGRYRQFFQLDVEAIGGAGAALDAEIIELARDWLTGVGLSDLRLELNSIGDSACRPAYLEILKDYYRPLRDRLSADSQQRIERNPLRLLDSKAPEDATFKASAPRITDHLCEACAEHWAAVRAMLDAAGIEYVVNPYLVRGLDYYTRTVFEFYPGGATGQQDALGGGGRYDGLAEAEGWPPTPAVGFASGLDRVTDLMAASGQEVIAEPPAEVLVLPDPGLEVEAAELARSIRAERSVAVDYEPRSLRAKMRSANKLGVRWVVLLSVDDARQRIATLREMAGGEQSILSWAELPARLA